MSNAKGQRWLPRATVNDTSDIIIPVSAEPESGAAVRCTDWLEHRIKTLENEIECACNAITDSVLCSGNDPKTTLHFVRKLRRAARCSNDQAQALRRTT